LFFFLFLLVNLNLVFPEDVNSQDLPAPIFSTGSGFYPDSFTLSLSTDAEDAVILYTLDGSVPNPDHIGGTTYELEMVVGEELTERLMETFVYSSPLQIEDRSSQPNSVSTISTHHNRFNQPASIIPKAMVVRAAVFADDVTGPVSTHTYFVGDDMLDFLELPVLSITGQEDSFWSYEEGILVPGKLFDPDKKPIWSDNGNPFQRGREWEREVHAEYFDRSGTSGFSQKAGIRIHGGTSRYFVNRSMRLYARSDYGNNTIEYPLFKNRGPQVHKRLKLRTSGQDYRSTFFRDALMTLLMINSEVTAEDYQPVNLFINGEYWGITNLRERFDNHYAERNFDIPRDEVEILSSWESTNEHYSEFRSFVDNTAPDSPGYYEEINNRIYLDSFLDLKIAEIFFGRYDHHWEVWRDGRDPESRWRWVMWDFDVGMLLPGYSPGGSGGWDWEGPDEIDITVNYLERFLEDYFTSTYNREFSGIMKNNDVRNRFLNRLAHMLSTNLHSNHINSEITRIRSKLESSMPHHIERWRTSFSEIGTSVNWNSQIDMLRDFANNRQDIVYQQALDYFDLPGLAALEVEQTPVKGVVLVDGEYLTRYIAGYESKSGQDTWNGTFFRGIPIIISTQPSPGYVFSHWTGSVESADPSITVTLDGDFEITAHFVEDTGVPPHFDPFSFTNENVKYEEAFSQYRGSDQTLPDHMFLTWDEGRLANPFTGIGHFDNSNPETEYGNFTAYTSDGQDFSFGIRERAPGDLRDARLFFAFTNDTGEPISHFRVSYEVEAWFIGDRRNRIRLKYDNQVISNDRETFETDIFSTDNPSQITTPNTKVNGSLDDNRVRVSGVVDITKIDNGTGVSFQPLAPGETAYFRWQFSNITGDQGSLRSGLAINNIYISIHGASEGHPFEYTGGWNLAGLPVDEGPLPYQSVFYNASQPPYLFDTQYEESQNLVTGMGYWIHLNSDETVYFTGAELTRLDLQLNEGWNLVSGLGHSLPEAAVEDNQGIINSAWHGFNGAYYIATTIEPGYGYWVRASEPGTVTLEHSAAKLLVAKQTEQPWHRFNLNEDFNALYFISGRDTLQTLYFGGELPEEIPASRFVMPPVPPTEAFDARFVGIESRLAESSAPQIAIQAGEREVEVHLHSPALSAMQRWEIVQTEDGRPVDRQTLLDGEAIALHSADVTHIELVHMDGSFAEDGSDLPNQFALKQNYPNPFNPTTVIQYQLPVASDVRLDVYDMTGRHVATLVNGQVSAGSHTVTFDGTNLSSGVYMYRLQAGEFQQVRRLTIIK